MRTRHTLLLAPCLLTLAASAVGMQGDQKASAKLFVRQEGEVVRAAVEIKLEPGWHLYHSDPGPTDLGVPTRLELGGEEIAWSEVRFPEPHRHPLPPELAEPPDDWIWDHHGPLVLYAAGRAPPGTDASEVSAEVSGVTCEDDGVCISYAESLESSGAGPDGLFAAFPSDLAPPPANGAAADAAGAADVAGGADAADLPDGRGAAGTAEAAEPAGPGDGPTGFEDEEPEGLLAFLALAVFWGLFTLLMPCTYPMIPITISFFTKQALQKRGKQLSLALVYGAGIILIFVLIGVLLGAPIIRFATHPVTNIIIGALFFVFALALFGVIDLQPPRFLMNAAGRASMVGGYLGVFLMGVTLVVTSFTCTAPFVGSLLAVGAVEGDLGRIALGMAVFGATMAVPFVLLSLLPGKMSAMPRSGEWMHVLKVTLGFVELAAALKFLSNADLVWHWGLLSREIFLLLWFGIFLVAALFLLGLIRLKGEEPAIGPGRMVAGTGVFLFALYCGFGALGHPLDRIMLAIAPNYSNSSGAGFLAGGGTKGSGPVIVKDDYNEARRIATAEGKQLLVNFTGFT